MMSHCMCERSVAYVQCRLACPLHPALTRFWVGLNQLQITLAVTKTLAMILLQMNNYMSKLSVCMSPVYRAVDKLNSSSTQDPSKLAGLITHLRQPY